MRMTLLKVLVGGIAALSFAASAVAHHSFSAEFDSAKVVNFTGTVTSVEWLNPHVFFYVDVRNETTGRVANWAAEMGSPNALTRQGWTRNTLKNGMKVSFEGTLAKDGSNKVNARNVSVDGKKLGAGSSESATP